MRILATQLRSFNKIVGWQGQQKWFPSGGAMEHWKLLLADKKNFWILDTLEWLKQ